MEKQNNGNHIVLSSKMTFDCFAISLAVKSDSVIWFQVDRYTHSYARLINVLMRVHTIATLGISRSGYHIT